MTNHEVAALPLPAAGVAAGEARINFAAHQVRAGPLGAREDFERMIGQLVRAIRPGARMVAANPGDWGIDVLVGELAGSVVIWQSKFFVPEVSKNHQSQIRESFQSAMKHAGEQGFAVTQWVLCVPSSMDGPTTKWWDAWKKKQSRLHSVIIELWDETELSDLLISPDASDVRRHFYEPHVSPSSPTAPEVIELAPEESEQLESALFVRQLRAAGHIEVDGSKRQFFNADLMAREIADKGVPGEMAALTHADALVHSLWEERFNEACHDPTHPSLLPGLHRAVMGDIRSQHATVCTGLAASPVHASGLMHRVVDSRRAGWIRDWRSVAAANQHPDGASSPPPLGPTP